MTPTPPPPSTPDQMIGRFNVTRHIQEVMEQWRPRNQAIVDAFIAQIRAFDFGAAARAEYLRRKEEKKKKENNEQTPTKIVTTTAPSPPNVSSTTPSSSTPAATKYELSKKGDADIEQWDSDSDDRENDVKKKHEVVAAAPPPPQSRTQKKQESPVPPSPPQKQRAASPPTPPPQTRTSPSSSSMTTNARGSPICQVLRDPRRLPANVVREPPPPSPRSSRKKNNRYNDNRSTNQRNPPPRPRPTPPPPSSRPVSPPPPTRRNQQEQQQQRSPSFPSRGASDHRTPRREFVYPPVRRAPCLPMVDDEWEEEREPDEDIYHRHHQLSQLVYSGRAFQTLTTNDDEE